MKKTYIYLIFILFCLGFQNCLCERRGGNYEAYYSHIGFDVKNATFAYYSTSYGNWNGIYKFRFLGHKYKPFTDTPTTHGKIKSWISDPLGFGSPSTDRQPIPSTSKDANFSHLIESIPGITFIRYRISDDNGLYSRGYMYTRLDNPYLFFIPDDELYDESLSSSLWKTNSQIFTKSVSPDGGYLKHGSLLFSYDFNPTDFPYPPARVPRYFKLWNTESFSVRIETYKEDLSVVYNLYSEEETDRAWIFSTLSGLALDSKGREPLNQNIESSDLFRENSLKKYSPPNSDKVDGVLWQATASWQTVLSSGSVGTVFVSNAEYGGPYLMKIYNNASNQLLFIDRIRHPYLSKEELRPYLNMTWQSAFASGLAIKPQLNWKRKDKITTNAMSIKAAESGYAHEFYASYPK